ncbi:ATP-dependent DNA helicase [Paenibacillus enshidis]|uniref:DNA 5'-3' helicase n=1 Tax=Paenibacillus enshidis TaxID=1458439 RepID=A0ABV5AVU6_9BACL
MIDFVERAFQQGGYLSRLIQGYSPREPQIRISTKVAEALDEGRHLLCEAGTGTGKSLGYLLPAAKWAIENKKKVIVCTHTIPLMNQIVSTELSRVAEIIQMDNPTHRLRYQLVKGKSHYICKSKLKLLRQDYSPGSSEGKMLEAILSKVKEGVHDRAEMGFPIDDHLWKKINATSCKDVKRDSECALELLKFNMSLVHIIVTNHAMFFQDLVMRKKLGRGTLPDYDAVIFDEAHEVEEVCCQAFEKKVSKRQLDILLNEFFAHDETQQLDMKSQLELNDLRREVEKEAGELFKSIQLRIGKSRYKLLSSPFGADRLIEAIAEFTKTSKKMKIKRSSEILERIFEYNDNLDFISQVERRSWGYWVSSEKGTVAFHAAPLFPKVVLGYGLFDKVPVILASATMSTGGNFNFFAGRMGVKEYGSITVDSPFDYANKTMLICPEGAPDASSPDFVPYLSDQIKEITMYSEGRMLVLFTSFETMRVVAQNLAPFAEEYGFLLKVQEVGSDREEIIQQLKTNSRTIVLGCTSFWTGVDVPGDALTVVVIAKLPFPQPDEPITQAQIKLIESVNRSSFFDFIFPKMMIKLKQGFGRLNRSMQCQGAVIILDNRVLTKRYGKMIIKGLPSCAFSRNLQDLMNILPC